MQVTFRGEKMAIISKTINSEVIKFVNCMYHLAGHAKKKKKKKESAAEMAPMEGNSPEELQGAETGNGKQILRGLWKDSGEGC